MICAPLLPCIPEHVRALLAQLVFLLLWGTFLALRVHPPEHS